MALSDTEATQGAGGCLCGGVRFEVTGPLRPVIACHCEQCRRTSGHFVAATGCAQADLTLIEDRSLRWFQSSEGAERGFCTTCGGNLFYRKRNPGNGRVSIMAGTLDAPTGLQVATHLFVAAKSDYYTIDDAAQKLTGDYGSPDFSPADEI